MFTILLKLHRYLGILLSSVIALWCASGIVMMYQQYPTLTDNEKVSSLTTLDFTNCCVDLETLNLDYDGDYIEIEMLSGNPIMRFSSFYDEFTVSLVDGTFINEINNEQALSVVTNYLYNNNINFNISNITSELINSDQWTIYGTSVRKPPYARYEINNKEKTHLYVSLITGELAQVTDRRERIFATLGPVIHWIYPKAIRDNPSLWSKIIISLTILSSFLCFFGIYIGIKKIKLISGVNINRCKNINYIHHISGLFLGVLLLCWIISGLLSINPFGVLEGRSFHQEYYLNSESGLSMGNISMLIESLNDKGIPEKAVKIYASKVNNTPYAISISGNLEKDRLDIVSLEKSDLAIEDLKIVGANLRDDAGIIEQGWLSEGDSYYYSHHNDRPFPTYKIEYSDGEIIYLNNLTAKINLIIDSNRKLYRWLFAGVHRFDFFKEVRKRPFWDIIMLSIQLSLLLFAFTGLILGFKSLRNIIKRLVRKIFKFNQR
ncbi:MAG: hypothetical protein CBC38_00730 [Gammaproteobacteria bacterium TMED78]|nr:MAG: hypothetical protein CBC38_00730 [Gammaproteobacteria bacterium TMED78]|tara:strand:+ start:87791 stop:89263 length:1473 start_codon:yes stop_codon:yes gene_type:complete